MISHKFLKLSFVNKSNNIFICSVTGEFFFSYYFNLTVYVVVFVYYSQEVLIAETSVSTSSDPAPVKASPQPGPSPAQRRDPAPAAKPSAPRQEKESVQAEDFLPVCVTYTMI